MEDILAQDIEDGVVAQPDPMAYLPQWSTK